MNQTIYTETTWRQPFRPKQLSILARLYAASARTWPGRIPTALWRRACLGAYGLMSRTGMAARSAFELCVGEEYRRIEFDARNTQFCSVYLPQYVRHGYEPETTGLLDVLLASGGGFYDIGSNWGHISLHVASGSFDGPIHAFEPFPSTYRDLARTVAQAGLEGRITCHQLALSDTNSTRVMRMPDSLTSGNAAICAHEKGTSVRSIRLDELELPPPTVMKIDVEGHEGEVLAGGMRTIADARPEIIFESWCSADSRETLRPMLLLQQAGYHFYQPVIVALDEVSPFVVAHGITIQAQKRALGLVEFEPDQRPLLARHINVLACHRSRRKRLHCLFPHVIGRKRNLVRCA